MADQVWVVWARNDAAIPSAFCYPPMPSYDAASRAGQRLIARYHSRRLAAFLLETLLLRAGFSPDLRHSLTKTASGRPYFPNHPEIDFNLSHSGEGVALIFAHSRAGKRARAVGIDLEQPNKMRRYAALLAQYASAQEQAQYHDSHVLPELSNEADRFYLSWCAREAMLKAQGVGLVALSSVVGDWAQKRFQTAHCPAGELRYARLDSLSRPSHLAYFVESRAEALAVSHFQWQAGELRPVALDYLTFEVNPEA